MKAIVCDRYGPPDVLRLADVTKPQPKDNQVLIKVHAATVTQGDCEVRAFRLAGWIWVPARIAIGITRPRQPILGMEVAGEVEAVGRSVTEFAVGDRVFASTGFGMGAYAEYACVPGGGPIARIPDGVSYAEAAGIPTGGLNGLHFVRRCKVQPGEAVLINGAGGAIGSFAVQFAKQAGAEVTAVDRGDKLDMLRALGADHVIDYKQEDFTRNGKRYDVIIDVVGKSPFSRSVAALNEHGRYFLGNPRAWQMLRAVWTTRKDGKTVLFDFALESRDDLNQLMGMVAAGALKVVIDRTYPLEQTAEAHRYVEASNKKGIVVISVAHAQG
jgi:NADPH:quinone reductase-like Zn-dependent oxidoreductase